LVSPYLRDSAATGPTRQSVAVAVLSGGHSSYFYCAEGMTTAASPETVFAYGPRIPQGRCFLYGDGHAECENVAYSDYVLGELAAGRNPPRPLPRDWHP
jgi:hypothetical protein